MRASVLLLQRGLGPLSYHVPDGTPLGAIVEAPLGPRRVIGVVWEAENEGGNGQVPDRKLRAATPVDRPPLSEPLRQLLAFVADYYLGDMGAVLKMALPGAAFLAAPRAAPCFQLGMLPPAATKQRRALFERLTQASTGTGWPLARWAKEARSTTKTLQAAVREGLLVAADSDTADKLRYTSAAPAPPPLLSPAQRAATDAITAAVAARAFQPFLLEGVTGSGKTEVYLEAIDAVLRQGSENPDSNPGQSLVLLPEISLTEGWLQRFRHRFGFEPAIWHSALGPKARRDTFRAIASGRAPVIVGARSAVLLPIPGLRLVIVDEAHDPAFKQEDGVSYNGRDVAVMRARFHGCPIVLATATPPLETLEQVATGTYRQLLLPDRHGGASLPAIHLVDLRKTPPPRGRWIAPPLERAIEQRLAAKEQTLLFLNRRGYAPLTLCRHCGHRIRCPNCSSWLVLHRGAERLLCHHCGHGLALPDRCPECGEPDCLVPCGPGVERLLEEAEQLWPAARILVATSDTIRTQTEMARLVRAVDSHEVDILIGTQILAKGHDFPELTLVGVIDGDMGLEGGDLRAAERSFQQIRQVAGRAGRGQKPGEVFLQTWQPEARVMRALAQQDAAGFHAAEREGRLKTGMPPFGRLAAVIVAATAADKAAEAARALLRLAPRAAGIELYGPAPAPLAMLRGWHRQRFLARADRKAPLQGWLRAWLGQARHQKDVRIQVDIDPQNFL